MIKSIKNRNHVKSVISGLSALIIVFIFACSIILLPVSQALAVDCNEIRNKLKVHKSQKKAREESLKRLIKELERREEKIFNEKHPIGYSEAAEKYSLALAFYTCLSEDIQIVMTGGIYDCQQIKAKFVRGYESVSKAEEQVKNTENIIMELSSKIHIAQRHYQDNNCDDSLLPADSFEQWKESGPQGWSGTWTRQGNSHLFEVVWTKESNTVTATVNFYLVKGNKWEGKRIESSDGVICTYYGTISDDGGRISGNGNCTNNTEFKWSAKIIKKGALE